MADGTLWSYPGHSYSYPATQPQYSAPSGTPTIHADPTYLSPAHVVQHTAHSIDRDPVPVSPSRLAEREAALKSREANLEQELDRLRKLFAGGVVITINVGGVVFQTLHSTLTKFPTSRLAHMFSPLGMKGLQRDADGYVYLNRPANTFSVILDWLRTGHAYEVTDRTLYAQLCEEVEYFRLPFDVTFKDPSPASPPVSRQRAAAEAKFPIGSTVEAVNLVKHRHLNGVEGTVVDYGDVVPEGGGESVLHVLVVFRPAAVHGALAVNPRNLRLVSQPQSTPAEPGQHSFVWDAKRCGRGVVISGASRDTVTGAAGCAIASQGYLKGVHTWRLHVLEGGASSVRVGVCRSGYSQPHLSPWGKAGSWLVAGDGSRWAGYTGGKHSPPPMLGAMTGTMAGKCIEVTLDCDRHTLAVAIDGMMLQCPNDSTAPAFHNLPPEVLMPIVSFYQGEVQARLELVS